MKKVILVITIFISLLFITNTSAKVDIEQTHIIVNGTELKPQKDTYKYTFKVGYDNHENIPYINAIDNYEYEGLGYYQIDNNSKDIKLTITDPTDGDKKEVIITLIGDELMKKKINIKSYIVTFFMFFVYIIVVFLLSKLLIMLIIKIIELIKK